MILLIRYGSMELRTFWTNLNSIMILLIRLRSETFDASQDNLNSIMILLIPRMPLYFALFQSYLNSIMILLILNVTEIITGTRMLFKFHYDSINSGLAASIASVIMNLNSIMILLIQKRSKR